MRPASYSPEQALTSRTDPDPARALGAGSRIVVVERRRRGDDVSTRAYVLDLIDRLQEAGECTVLRHEGAGTSGRALLATIYRAAQALDELGIGRGDVVALYAPNRPEALAVRYATHLVGAASVFLSAPPDPEKRARMLVDFEPGLVVVWPETAHLLP